MNNIMSRVAGSRSAGKKILFLFSNTVMIAALALGAFLPIAQASVVVSSQPVALVSSPITLPANSAQTAVFTFSLMATGGETFSNISVEIDQANASTQVLATHIASVSVYRDDGSGQFNASAGNLIGSQNVVVLGTPIQIVPIVGFIPAGKYYVTLATSSLWGGSGAQADSVTLTLPSNAINTSANSPLTSAVTSAAISAGTASPTLISAVAQNTGGTLAKEGGDSVALTFSQPTNKFSVNSTNINNQFTLNNGHSFLDSSGNLGGANWSTDGTVLTLVLSGQSAVPSSLPSVTPGDTVSVASSTSISGASSGNPAAGSSTISGSFGASSIVASPSVSLTLSAAQSQFNSPDYATAFLNNVTSTAGGTVTYNVYPTNNCTGSPVFTDSETVSNGITPLSKDFSTTASGTYSWQAVYSGDANNGLITSSCQAEMVLAPGQSPGQQQVAGVSTSLPRTGMPVGVLFLIMLGIAGLLSYKFKLV